jgi:dihydrofolate synthase/folylpolyglutamate synthase
VNVAARSRLNYKEALAWLYGLQRFGIKLGLENTRRLLDELSRSGGFQAAVGDLPPLQGYGVPREIALPWKVIHVAGTNGKGSVCAMIDAICRAQGYRTGLFTSPHLVTFRERIRVDGQLMPQDAVADGLSIIRDIVGDWQPHPTFFEVTTALALKYFLDFAGRGAKRNSDQLPSSSPLPSRRAERIKVRGDSPDRDKLDVVILETGIGGRLDATNAVQSDVAVITSIGFDHEEWLGNTLAEIASEKAGIIKQGTPVVCAPQEPEAEQVIRARASECAAPLEIVAYSYEKTPVALAGAHQKQNAALAIAALRAAKIDVDQAAISRGLASIEWPARFQRWDDRTVIDGAHNPEAARALVQTWREVFGDEKATLVLAILSDKNLRSICETLMPIASFVVLPNIRSQRSAPPEQLAKILTAIAPTLPHSITSSVAQALDVARAKPNPILVTGSLHFAGEVIAYLRGEPAAFEECAQ